MQPKLLIFLAFVLVLNAPRAMAEKFLGTASGSIEILTCLGAFENQTKEYIRITKQERNSEGFVDALQLKAFWHDNRSGKEHFAFFDVIYVSVDEPKNTLLVVGRSEGRNSIELNIPLSAPGESRESQMKINGSAQDFFQLFTCSAVRAG